MSELSCLNREAKDTELATTRRLRSVFSEAHVPGKNGFNCFFALRGEKLCEAFRSDSVCLHSEADRKGPPLCVLSLCIIALPQRVCGLRTILTL